jgi:hypothetical protein
MQMSVKPSRCMGRMKNKPSVQVEEETIGVQVGESSEDIRLEGIHRVDGNLRVDNNPKVKESPRTEENPRVGIK